MTTDYKNATYGGLTFDEAMKLQNQFKKDANAEMAKLVKKYESFFKLLGDEVAENIELNEQAVLENCKELIDTVEGMQSLSKFGVEFYVAFGEYEDTLSTLMNNLIEAVEAAGKGNYQNKTELWRKVYEACSSVESAESDSYQWHNSNCY